MVINHEETEQDFEPTTEDWQLYFLSLKPYPVWIWYASLIKPQAAPGSELHTTARRLFQHLLTYIRCSVLAHQHARKKIVGPDGVTYLVAEWQDYLLADRLLRMNAPKPLQQLPDRARKAFDKLKNKLALGKPYTTGELAKLLNQPATTAKNWIRKFVDTGLLEQADEKKGSAYLYRIGGAEADSQDLGLVDPKSIDQERVEEKYRTAQKSISSPTTNGPLEATPVQ